MMHFSRGIPLALLSNVPLPGRNEKFRPQGGVAPLVHGCGMWFTSTDVVYRFGVGELVTG